MLLPAVVAGAHYTHPILKSNEDPFGFDLDWHCPFQGAPDLSAPTEWQR